MHPVRAGRSPLSLKKLFSPAGSRSFWKRSALDPAQKISDGLGSSDAARAGRFRQLLDERGGLFAVFGQFLAGRADLLPADFLTALSGIAPRRQPAAPPLPPEMRDRLAHVEWLRSAPCSEMYAASHEGLPVIVEVFLANGYAQGEFAELGQQLQLLRRGPEAALARPAVLEQFREWLALQADAERKRAALRIVKEVPVACLTRFPALIAELQSSRCLAYERVDGSPLAEALADPARSSQALDLWAESLLEQALFLSIVDADAQASNYAVIAGGGLALRIVPAPAPVPVEWHDCLLQYLAAAIAGNSGRAMQMLARVCAAGNPVDAERLLLSRLSALQPELRIDGQIPDTVATLENYWRALRDANLPAPLFWELFHRNLAELGRTGAQTPLAAGTSAGPPPDAVAAALWPVLGRLVQFRAGEILSSDKSREWLANSGLLLLMAMRQAAVFLEQVRDNDLAFEIESEPKPAQRRKRNRRAASVIHCGIGLVLFLFSLQLAHRATGVWEIGAGTAAVICAVAVFLLVARIE